MDMPTTELPMSDYILATGAALSEDSFYPTFSIADPAGTVLFAWRARFGFDTREIALVHAREYGCEAAAVLLTTCFPN